MNENCEKYSDKLMALRDGVLPPEESSAVRAHLLACPACRHEFDGLSELEEDFLTLGQQVYNAVPPVDLVEGVMTAAVVELLTEANGLPEDADTIAFEAELEALGKIVSTGVPKVDLAGDVLAAVATQKQAPSKVVPLRTRPKPCVQTVGSPRARTSMWLGLAAAACLLIALGLTVTQWLPAQKDILTMARGDGVASAPGSLQDTNNSAAGGPSFSMDGEPFAAISEDATPVATDAEVPESDVKPVRKTKAVTLQDAINARREALLKNADALSRLGQWASLPPGEARDLIENAGLSISALIGATQFLPEDEAAAILSAAAEENPHDPYLRYALAKAYGGGLADYDAARQQLDAWTQADPENALPLYMEARVRFIEGDSAGAMTALQTAATYQKAEAYALDAARQREQVLIASGLDPEVARMLAASTAGTTEYNDLISLGEELLRYGQEYQEAGDYQTAEQIYAAVRQMGLQADSGAGLLNDSLAALDIQHSAIDALFGLYEVFANPSNRQIIEAAYQELMRGFAQLAEFLTTYINMMDAATPEDISHLNDLTMSGNELSILDNL